MSNQESGISHLEAQSGFGFMTSVTWHLFIATKQHGYEFRLRAYFD
ncbi:hypothetical protein HMPREF1573_00989 [Gardnerella vaginalis JCP7276]|nr:hypothetical protein HMPREF1573_00989 [Gardnerella vaginalis JCP7276]